MSEGHGTEVGRIIIYRGYDPQEYILQLERELTAERERADRNQEDAERYRWLARHRALIVPEYGEEILRGNAIRVAILKEAGE